MTSIQIIPSTELTTKGSYMNSYLYNELINAVVYWSFGAGMGMTISAGIYFYAVGCNFPENENKWWNHKQYTWSPLHKFTNYFES